MTRMTVHAAFFTTCLETLPRRSLSSDERFDLPTTIVSQS